jgi:hypothetical protein
MTLSEAPRVIRAASTAIAAASPLALSTPVTATPDPAASTPVPAGEMETHALKRRADGSLEPDASASLRRWLPWAVVVAALLAITAEIVTLGLAGPIPVAVTHRGPALPEGLRIETQPLGASVWIDGRVAGEAPLSIRDLRAGLHRVRVAEEGYAPAELTFEIPEGVSPPPLRFVMAPLFAPTEVFSDPAAAAVTVDGRPVGTTPVERLTLGPGPHTIRLEREQFASTTPPPSLPPLSSRLRSRWRRATS